MVLLGHNINEKQPTRIFTPTSSFGQVPPEVESKPYISVLKCKKRGFRSRLVAVSSEVLYSQKGTLNTHHDLPLNYFEKEVNESEKAKENEDSGILPTVSVEVREIKAGRYANIKSIKSDLKAKLYGSGRKPKLPDAPVLEEKVELLDSSGIDKIIDSNRKVESEDALFKRTVAGLSLTPSSEEVGPQLCAEGKTAISSLTKQIIIHKSIWRPGELLDNNRFNDWQNSTPCKWKSDNVLRTREALTGNYAVRLGSNSEKKAYLYQDIIALPGYFYEIKCNFKMPVAHARAPAIKLMWLNSNTEIIEYGINVSIATDEKPYYHYITGVTTKSPRNVVYGRVYFEKHNIGVFDIDMVSFICL